MAFHFITGNLGGGKSLVSVAKIKERLISGCPVATNLDIDLVEMFGSITDKPRVLRVPDKPTVFDLENIGIGNASYDEEKNGLLVLDECGTWFNSRNWQDKTRKEVNDWFLHARKLGWDVLLIVQDISLIDSQARSALAEHTVFCKRLDRIRIPVLSTIWKAFFGKPLTFPKVHFAKVVYGESITDLMVDRWVYRGTDLYSTYDTKQLFLTDYSHGVYSVLTPWHLKGRYQVPRNLEFYMRMTRIVWKRFKSPFALVAGVVLGSLISTTLLGSFLFSELQTRIDSLPEATSPGTTSPGTTSIPTDQEVEEPNFLLSKFSDLKITGHTNINGNYIYHFSNDLSSQAIASTGINIIKVSSCEAMFVRGREEFPVYCY